MSPACFVQLNYRSAVFVESICRPDSDLSCLLAELFGRRFNWEIACSTTESFNVAVLSEF